jgi:hypothetical protein
VPARYGCQTEAGFLTITIEDTMQPPFDADTVLECNLFEGDYGDGERVLRNVIGKNRKSFDCQLCADTQAPGGWARMLTEAGPDGMVTYRWCAACCQAMAVYESGDGRMLNARQSIGDAARREARPPNPQG